MSSSKDNGDEYFEDENLAFLPADHVYLFFYFNKLMM